MSEALDIARRAFEARFAQVVIGPPCAHAFAGANGEYVALHIKAGSDEIFSSEEQAIAALFRELNGYADTAERDGCQILIWRIAPETAYRDGASEGEARVKSRWKYYARLLIANRLPDAEAA